MDQLVVEAYRAPLVMLDQLVHLENKDNQVLVDMLEKEDLVVPKVKKVNKGNKENGVVLDHQDYRE
jgi:hypothetical protein